MSASRPNLFAFGRSELSQDAFLCWLLAWADRSYTQHDPALHGLGRAFLEALFRAANPSPALPPEPCTVQILQQLGDCDIVALVGEKHVLLIEDKTDATHDNPLETYCKRVLARHPGRTPVCIYLKTGDQHSYERITASGWTVFGRERLLSVLRGGRDTVRSEIFHDYLLRLEAIEAETQSFLTAPPKDWPWRAWSGFYLALQRKMGSGWWGYVANPSGGFMAFTWGWRHLEDGNELYAQLEQHKLVVKVHVPQPADRRRVRDAWVARMVGTHQTLTFRRPQRLGHGQWMTVAELDSDYRIVGPEGRLDLDQTVALLQRVAAVVVTASTAERSTSGRPTAPPSTGTVCQPSSSGRSSCAR